MKILSVLILLLLAFPAFAQDWVLALSWHPGFCETAPKRAECQAPRPQLVLHGLWPQTSSCSQQPKGRWDQLPQTQVSPATRARMAELFPGAASHLDRYQWAKHGRCSGWDQDHYFSKALDLTQAATQGATAHFLTRQSGRFAPLPDLCKALAQDLGPDATRAVSLVRDRDGALTEIRVSLKEKKGNLEWGPDYLGVRDKSIQCQGLIHIPGP